MSDSDLRQHAPATERNRSFILAVLERVLPTSGTVLEIGSGSGEHIVFFAQHLAGLTWQPSEMTERALPSIEAWVDHAGVKNVLAPITLDVNADDWRTDDLAAIFCCNVIHYSPWHSTLALLDGAARRLPEGGVLYFYGPYRRNGQHTSPSNETFDAWLKQRNPAFGVRDLETVQAEAASRGLALSEVIDMPANNLSLVFTKQ